MPPTSVHRFVAWTRLGNKSREQLHRPTTQDDTIPPLPKDGREKGNNAEAADPLPSRDSLDRHSANVGQSNTTPRSNGEDEDTEAPKDGTIIGEQTPSKAPAHSLGPGNDAVVGAPDARLDLLKPSSGTSAPAEQGPRGPPQLKHSKSFFTTFALTKKLRLRKCDPVPLDRTPDKSASTRMPCGPRQGTYRPQVVPIALPNDIASKERREEALRSLGLLPPRDLSALEADQDRRIDGLRKNTTSPPPSDNSHSDANKIAQSWRNCNSRWLSQSPPNSDTEDPMTESSSSTNASSHSGSLSELVTVGADASDLVPLMSSPSITKFLTLASHDSATQPLEAASSRMSQDSVSSRQNSHMSTGLEELALPSFCLGELLTTDILIMGVSEDMKTKTASTQSAPSSPVLSKTSCSPHSQDAERQQTSTPSLLSPSPSRQPEDSKTPVSPPQVTSEPRVESSPKALPVEPEPEPLEVTAQEKLSVPDLSPLLIFPNVSDRFLAFPTSPTLSSALCYSPSEVSDITPTVDNGDPVTSRITDIMTIKGRRADITPFADKKSEGALIQEVIVEGPEPFPDEDDLDPFASPLSPSFPTTVITPPASEPKTRATRTTTLGPSTSVGIAKPRSLVGLRHQFTNNLFRRPRARTTVSHLAPTDSSPAPSPLDVRVHNRSTILEEASRIDDDEVRRLSELAFMT